MATYWPRWVKVVELVARLRPVELPAPIVALWAVPRSTSTAFEWMMRQRGDLVCFHEPFGEVWYQGENPLWPRFDAAISIRTPALTFESRWAELVTEARQGPVFIKDFPHYLESFWDDAFLAHFTHSFLIRDPLKALLSMESKWPDFHMKETGFAEQRQLFDRLWAQAGTPPPVIDSDDLLERPAEIVEAWCEAVGLPFVAEALSWEPGPRDEVSWWDGGVFHATLRHSDGLKPQPGPQVSLADAPPRVRHVYGIMRPHYESLRAHRIRV